MAWLNRLEHSVINLVPNDAWLLSELFSASEITICSDDEVILRCKSIGKSTSTGPIRSVDAVTHAWLNFEVISVEDKILDADFVIGSATVLESKPCTPYARKSFIFSQ